MSIRIIAVGKKHESWVSEGIERYQSRLRRPYETDWVLLSHESGDELTIRRSESKLIQCKIPSSAFVVLLDERGSILSSPVFAANLLPCLESSLQVIFVIGGAYGVDDSLRDRADLVVSLSRLVFPHQLVRLMLVEQLYRAQEINHSRPYHHT